MFKSILSYIFYAYKDKETKVEVKERYWAIPDLIKNTVYNNINIRNTKYSLERTLSIIFQYNCVTRDAEPTKVNLPGFQY